MKYVRTENKIYQFENNENICKKDNELFEIQRFFQPVDHIHYKLLGKIIVEADTIEDLFMKGDLLVAGDNESEIPIFFESIKFLRAWLIYNGVYKIKKFYIKHGIDYHLEAKINKKGVLELI